jgi:autotransporter translocation and assembly factor TamB
MNTRNRKLGGHLTFDGASLTLFKTAIDTLSAKLNLKATELEIEQLDLKRKNDSLTAQGKIDMSHEHDYSGMISATVDDLAEYLSIFRGSAEKNSKRTPTHTQITIDSNKWNARGVIGLPNSSPVDFTANFPLPIGTDWTAFLASPINVTLDFPSIFLANAPQFFHPEIFREGVLSGTLSLSETLQHPRITGETQLVNGRLQNAPLDLTEANGRVTFSGNRASLDFFNAAANDVDLSFLGEIDFHDRNDVVIKIAGATPIFDLTMRPIDCVGKIEIGAVAIALAPAVAEIELRGGLFQSGWTVGLKERISAQSFGALDPNETARTFPLCSSSTNAEEKTLFLGAPGRPAARRETIRPKKRKK